MDRLTARETQIAQLVGQGLTNDEISMRLKIRPQTVKNHLAAVYRKLRLKNRVQLTLHLLPKVHGTNPSGKVIRPTIKSSRASSTDADSSDRIGS